ncbi:MAG: BrnT family toxin [Candidatus Binatus sp.]|uniref:BrnT family toxin n=1 Tax=Candidatus Binatus sp. TaxID=2811406 RepID=UPI002717BE5A|nr:BrnT family toxin [Candidatus Binatus sp.]MDO8431984.1 BrnT family toxin [Candidatus Binatus sp.]
MDFEWDEKKRAINLAAHGLDLIDATKLFDGRPVFTYPSPRHGEERFVTVGQLTNRFFAVVWTERVEAIRLISFRRARDAEERKYRTIFG